MPTGTPKSIDERAKQLLNDMLSPVDLHKLVAYDPRTKIITVGGERVDEARLQNLVSEAHALKEFELWKILYETPKELAQRAVFVEGDTIEQVRKGRTMLYLLDTQRKIIDTFLGYAQKK